MELTIYPKPLSQLLAGVDWAIEIKLSSCPWGEFPSVRDEAQGQGSEWGKLVRVSSVAKQRQSASRAVSTAHFTSTYSH